MEKIIIFGNGQMADIAYYYLTSDPSYKIVGFCVDKEFLKQSIFNKLPVVAFEDVQKVFSPKKFKMFLPLGYKNVNKLRAEKYQLAKEKGYSLISYVSKKAIVWPGLKVRENCLILENNVIQPFTEIGNDVILWSGNHIGHHSRIMDHCYLASHIVVSGRVTIGPYCFIGVNATIRDNITIGESSVIGAGTLILRDTPRKSVYCGQETRVSTITSDKLKNI